MAKEEVKANNLKYDPEFDEKHDPLTTNSAKEEENPNEENLDGVVAANLKKYDCFVCDKKFCFNYSRRKHNFHKDACHICGSAFSWCRSSLNTMYLPQRSLLFSKLWMRVLLG